MKWVQSSGGTSFTAEHEDFRLSIALISSVWQWHVFLLKDDTAHNIGSGTSPSLHVAQEHAEQCAEHGLDAVADAPTVYAVSTNTNCVYFVGSDSTGKSELTRYVARAYGLPKVHESARATLDEEGLTLQSLRAKSADADAYQRLVFDRQLERERQTPRPFVADRGLDNLAYASEHGRCFAELLERPEVREYVELQRQAVVFLVRPHRDLRAEDGVRALPSWEGQQRIDAKVEMLLQMWRVPHVVIAESSSARREELIDWCLEARGFVKCKS